ncbi:GerMN domain-containing protein [Peribacillus alkalitolerans]|uniref:GerMN domain-containing protein n=1 Tax=Peribacillus alkalitolerans TaxID=1550385 RepID=UPI0013D6C029|nr:GerMN domain-containing protein [Peribacillus alkalitolerans]
MSKKRNVTIATTILASSVLLGGCGLLGGEKKKDIDPPKEVTYVEDADKLEGKDTESKGKVEAEQKTVMTELYLIDKNGFVVPQSVALPGNEGVAKQALEYLVENGPVSNILPNGFRAVLPADTEVGVNINKDGVAVVDFSPEFATYKAEDELKILQSITWTLTQFDSVKSVKLRINGHEINEMPVNQTPITDAVSRENGINLDTTSVVDITNTKPVTIYYIGGEEGSYYYVPVTKRVGDNASDPVTAVVNELTKAPNFASHLLTEFMPDVKLVEAPKVADGKVTLNFNESIYGGFEEKTISQSLLTALVLTLTEQEGIESVEVLINGKAELKNAEGKPLTEPVVRPEKVNTGSF